MAKMTVEELAKQIMKEMAADGEPVTEAEAKEMAEMELKAKKDCRRYESDKRKVKKPSTREKKIDTEKTNSAKDKLYRQLLADNHVKSNKIDLIMRTVDLDKLELDGEKLKGSEDLNKEILKDWQDFIEVTEVKGTNTATPPNQTSENSVDLGSLSMEDYIKARQQK